MRKLTIKELKTVGTELNIPDKADFKKISLKRHSSWTTLHLNKREFKVIAIGKHLDEQECIFFNYCQDIDYSWITPISEFIRLGLVEEEFILPKYWFIRNIYQDVRDYLANKYNKEVKYWWGYEYIGYSGVSSYNGCHGFEEGNQLNNSIEITYEQFCKYVLKENKEENMKKRKIIGYRCPIDLWAEQDTYPKKGDLYIKINFGNYQWEKDKKDCFNIAKEIVETWEPVYEEEFKVGDIVVLTKADIYSEKDKIVGSLVSLENGNSLYPILIKSYSLNRNIYCSKIRKATLEEIKAAQEIKIGEYIIEFLKEGFKIGCGEYNIEDLNVCLEVLKLKNISHIDFSGNKITKETCERILERLN